MLKNNKIRDAVRVAPEKGGRKRPAPVDTRVPRRFDRLQRYGVKCLSDSELLVLVLGGRRGESAGVMAERLLEAGRGPAGLAASAFAVLCRDAALGPSRAARLLAALELGRRCRPLPRILGLKVSGPRDLHHLLDEEIGGCEREHFLALYLDSRHRVLAVETVSIGTLNASLVHPREVFRPAVKMGAAAIVAAHNHPSGSARPSGDDLDLTRRLSECGALLGIEVLDHIVVGLGRQTSIREAGWPVSAGSP